MLLLFQCGPALTQFLIIGFLSVACGYWYFEVSFRRHVLCLGNPSYVHYFSLHISCKSQMSIVPL